jgi:hypothetical protein
LRKIQRLKMEPDILKNAIIYLCIALALYIIFLFRLKLITFDNKINFKCQLLRIKTSLAKYICIKKMAIISVIFKLFHSWTVRNYKTYVLVALNYNSIDNNHISIFNSFCKLSKTNLIRIDLSNCIVKIRQKPNKFY